MQPRHRFFRFACRIGYHLPEPLPIAAAIVALVVLGACLGCSPARAQLVTDPIVQLQPGQRLTCMRDDGCIAMTREFFEHLLQRIQATEQQQTCRRDPST